MSYSLPKRMIDLYGLLTICFLPLLLTFVVYNSTESHTYFIITKVIFIILYVSFLVSSGLLEWLKSKFPALKTYVIRFSLTAFLLLMSVFFEAHPEDGMVYWTAILSILLATIFISVAKIGAILGI